MSGLGDIFLVGAVLALTLLVFWLGALAGDDDARKEIEEETEKNVQSRRETDAEIDALPASERRQRLAEWVRKDPK